MDAKLFTEGLKFVGLSANGLSLEGFRTDGTSNYLANLNFRGQTWAAALRMPAAGALIEEFVADKLKALLVVDYLIPILSAGIDVGSDCQLRFCGLSCLLDGLSTQEQLREITFCPTVRLVDMIGDRVRELTHFDYPHALPDDTRAYVESYQGPFYLSRGAPAWETLEEYIDLEESVSHALATLHRMTGIGRPAPFSDAQQLLNTIESSFRAAAEAWTPIPNSKEERALNKARLRWETANDERRERLIKSERFLRSSAGRTCLNTELVKALNANHRLQNSLRSFIHGDCHAGNFILVRYRYQLDRPEVIVDRVFLNEIFEASPNINEIAVSIDDDTHEIAYTQPVVHAKESARARRHTHHEIHLVDLDSGHGITEDTKQNYLFDIISYCISVSNISELHSEPIPSDTVLTHYYDIV